MDSVRGVKLGSGAGGGPAFQPGRLAFGGEECPDCLCAEAIEHPSETSIYTSRGGPTRSHKVAQIDWIAMTLTKELFPVTVKVTAKPATLRPDSEVGIQRCYRAAAHLTPARHPQERLNRLALPGLGMRAALSHSPERAIPHPRASSAPSSSTPFDMFEVSCKAGRSRAHRHT